jgi:CheY-like chemotaxis protein
VINRVKARGTGWDGAVSTQLVSPSYRILVWNAQPLGAQILSRVLVNAGHRATVVVTEDDALTALERNFFDLLIVHQSTPEDMDLTLLKLHRFAHLDEPQLPAIVLVPEADAAVQDQCRDAGVDIILTLPVRPNQVLDAINDLTSLIQRRRMAV